MISELSIKNIALISSLRIELSEGFNVLSGETGAGKSIIVDSVNLILGSRADRDLIRAGEESARVEALVTFKDMDISHTLAGYGIEDNGNEMIVSRELSSSGKNVCRINGQLVSLSVLRDIMSMYVDICGQNDNIGLLDESYHLRLIDEFGHEEIDPLREEVRKAFVVYADTKKRIEDLKKEEKDKARLLDIYTYQIEEIERYELEPGEDEELESERDIMLNAEKIATHLYSAKESVSGDGGAKESLYDAMHEMSRISSYNEKYAEIEKILSDAYYQIDELSYDLDHEASSVRYDSRRLQVIEDRLHDINMLKKKYGSTIQEILDFCSELKDKTEGLENSEEELKNLEKKLKVLTNELEGRSKALSDRRRATADAFEKQLLAELKDLGMKDAVLEMNFEKTEYTENGYDDFSFMISVNKGTPPRKLSKIASGGELSRIMLGIKNIVAETENIDTMIFDEIDTGISGKMALIVAEKIANISKMRQVICVTHLPQIAAMGDRNFYIEKKEVDGFTTTSLREIEGEDLVTEIARLSGGLQSETSHEHAEELLKNAEQVKNRDKK